MPPKAKPPIGVKTANHNEKVPKMQRGSSQSQSVLNPATEVVVRLNQNQSLNIIQTSVAASLSTILWIRNIFPQEYFEHRTYDLNSPTFEHEITSIDAFSLKRQGMDPSTVTWDMLVRGKHPHVDKMLYWLEGIDEAIKLKYLASFVISLHHDRISPETLAEAYILNFSYRGPGQQPQVGLTIGKDTVDITLQNQLDMKNLFNRLLKFACEHKGDFPEHPAIGMQLTYNDTCPEGYEPPGFRAAPPHKWIEHTGAIPVGEMDTGYHKLQMRMITPPSVIPNTPRRPAAVLHLDSSSSPSQPGALGNVTPQRRVRGLIQGMLAPNQGELDTQLPNTASESVGHANREAQGSSSVLQGRQTAPPHHARVFSFKSVLPKAVLQDSTQGVPLILGGADCVCGRSGDDEAHSCQHCGVAQHRSCYGLMEGDVVKSFFCYSCLLKKDQALLRKMKEICQLRSFLAIIATEGYPVNESELAKPTGYMVKEVKAASLTLLQEGYLLKVHRPNEKKAKAFRKGPMLPPFEFDETQRGRLLKEYWNPAYKLENSVETVSAKQTSVAKKQLATTTKAAIAPTPAPSQPPPAKNAAAFKNAVKPMKQVTLSLEDDDEDDDLSSVPSLSARKRKVEDGQGPLQAKKKARASEQRSPFVAR